MPEKIDYLWPFTRRLREEKRAWREHVARVKALPPDYRLVMTEIEKFMWSFALDAQIMSVQDDLLAMFEEAAASGRPVLDVTGDDVARFALDVLIEAQTRTWTGKKAAQLNRRVRTALGHQPDPDGTSEEKGDGDDR